MTDTTRWTPGPWVYRAETRTMPVQIWAGKCHIADVYGPTAEERAANGQVMAAAPQLVQALEEAWRIMALRQAASLQLAINGADTALAAARGEGPHD